MTNPQTEEIIDKLNDVKYGLLGVIFIDTGIPNKSHFVKSSSDELKLMCTNEVLTNEEVGGLTPYDILPYGNVELGVGDVCFACLRLMLKDHATDKRYIKKMVKLSGITPTAYAIYFNE
jgi:hypothetical protein